MKKNKEQERKMGECESLRTAPKAQCDFSVFILYNKKWLEKCMGKNELTYIWGVSLIRISGGNNIDPWTFNGKMYVEKNSKYQKYQCWFSLHCLSKRHVDRHLHHNVASELFGSLLIYLLNSVDSNHSYK